MITVGLDFGTHQTKLCVEKKEGVECSYTFLKFKDDKSIDHYTIPSVINIDDHGLLSYGYIPQKTKGRIIRYFKQSVFRSTKDQLMSQEDAMYYSIWKKHTGRSSPCKWEFPQIVVIMKMPKG